MFVLEIVNMVQSIERGIEILNLLKSGPLGVTELARATDLPKTTVHRLLKTFEAHHWVELNGALKKYQLSWGVLPMAKSFLMSLDVRAIAQPYMVAIRNQLQQYLPFTVLKPLTIDLTMSSSSRKLQQYLPFTVCDIWLSIT